ncbi:phage antirepressor KilAC domain-containing protein [Paenirhodobacter populi]|uniref:phage antirepressor KilAC domain-containing protein n=1 Tax=Paenirhodobacter populi TaxID=2306993 RepID=UPI000FE413F1|nr:hypothetical protein D2T32_21125 [Sinirhodobacter populi]
MALLRQGDAIARSSSAAALLVRGYDVRMAYLSQNGWIYKRAGSANWLGYQSKTTAGLLEHKITSITRADGSESASARHAMTGRSSARTAGHSDWGGS